MAPLLEGLEQLGVEVRSGTGRLPFTVVATGAVRGDAVTMDASSSSQFVSALLLAAARFDNGRSCATAVRRFALAATCRHDGAHAARGRRVVVTDTSDPSDASWHVEPGLLTPPSGPIEPDLSNAGPFLAAAMVTGGRVTVPDWPLDTSQAGDRLRVIFSEMGADAQLTASGLTLAAPNARAESRSTCQTSANSCRRWPRFALSPLAPPKSPASATYAATRPTG